MMKPTFPIFIATVLALSTGACSNRVTLREWQNELERYIAQQADEDASFLREGVPGASPGRFDVIGGEWAHKATDVTGLLLGRRKIQDRDWLIFLVGSVKNQTVQDIRIAL